MRLLATLPGRKTCEKYDLFYIISAKIQHLNAEFGSPRIAPENLLTETAGRKSFFESWYSMKDYENGGHRTRRNCKYNEENLLLCVNTWGQFILLCWVIRGYFQLLEKERESRHYVQMDLFRVIGLGRMVSFSYIEPENLKRAVLTLCYNLGAQVRTLTCVQFLSVRMTECPTASQQYSHQNWLFPHP